MNYEIIQGDSRTALASAPQYEAVITDPIWPNHSKVFDCESAFHLLNETLEALPKSVKRLVIVLGGDSDPRFLNAVPVKWPFLKTCFLEFCCPVHKGRNLYTHLMAYVYGEWPKSKVGARVIPSKAYSREAEKKLTWHPTPMRVSHAKWLVKWFGDGGVIDPFAGSGSIGLACKAHRIDFYGIEKNETYALKAAARLDEMAEPWC